MSNDGRWIGTLTDVFALKAMTMTPAEAASMIMEWSKRDPETANWLGRKIGWYDEGFQAKVYEIIEAAERTAEHVFRAQIEPVHLGAEQALVGPERLILR